MDPAVQKKFTRMLDPIVRVGKVAATFQPTEFYPKRETDGYELQPYIDRFVRPVLEEVRDCVDLADEKALRQREFHELEHIWLSVGQPLNTLLEHVRAFASTPQINGRSVLEHVIALRRGLDEYGYLSKSELRHVGHKVARARRQWTALHEKETAGITQLKTTLQEQITLAQTARVAHQELLQQAKLVAEGRVFDDLAKDHRAAATGWLKAAIGVATLMMAIAIGTIFFGSGPPLPAEGWTTAANIAHFGARGLLLTVLSFGLVVCVRSYRAGMHNQVTNEHRGKVIYAFHALSKGVHDNVRTALLSQTMATICASQPTGFTDGPGGATHIHETAKSLGLEPKPKED